jgi:enoyl-CoA hydratase/carnithine racemase
MFNLLKYVTGADVATITFARPAARNAFNSELYREFRDALRLADGDKNIEFIVVTGGPDIFGSGGDLAESLSVLASKDPLAPYRFGDVLPWEELRQCSKVTIAAINGYCLAGAAVAALLCDIAIASQSARIGLPEGRVGIAATIVTSILFGRVPAPKAKYLMLTGKMLGAAEAERYGLLTEVVPNGQVESRTAGLISELRATTPGARRLYKRYWDDLIPRKADSTGIASLLSDEARQSMERFFAEK